MTCRPPLRSTVIRRLDSDTRATGVAVLTVLLWIGLCSMPPSPADAQPQETFVAFSDA